MNRSICQGVALLIASQSVACAGTTTIRASDPSTRIYVDGEFRGKGVVAHQDTKTVGATTEVRLEKDGCAPQEHSFRRNEEIDVGAAVGGLFLLVPFLWVMKYKPTHSYTYRCEPARSKVVARNASRPPPLEKPPEALRETAQSAFAEGKQLWLAGKVSDACAKFARSQQLGPDTGTLLVLADCHTQEGALSLARLELEEALQRAQRENRPDRVQYAENRLQALASRD